MDQSMNNVETTQIQPPKLTKIKIENMNGDQVSYKVALLSKNQENHEKKRGSKICRASRLQHFNGIFEGKTQVIKLPT